MRCILFNKPFQVLTQFTDRQQRRTLREFIEEPGVYPAGRLDYDSEGLLLLTDDGTVQARVSDPRHRLAKTYWAQVEGEPRAEAAVQLQKGVTLNDGPARALLVRVIDEPVDLWPREPPIRYRREIPTHWLELQIDEGRNRQVRRMTAAVGLPTLRLIRHAIGPWKLDGLLPGESRTLTAEEVLHALRGARATQPRRRPSGKRSAR